MHDNGYSVYRSSLSEAELDELRDEVNRLNDHRGVGLRNSLETSALVARHVKDAFGLRHLLPNALRVVRCIIFDKSPQSNWKVGWHQDLNLKSEDGQILERDKLGLVKTFRLHLDKTNAENGALRVLPGSHNLGALSDEERRKLQTPEVTVDADAGEVLVMSPLLVHASNPMKANSRRRVIHVDYL